MSRLEKVSISGFKSIGERIDLSFGDVTVFLGANGSGKSNLVSFFRMMNHISTGALQKYVAESGMASSILHFGSDTTRTVRFSFDFCNGEWRDSYDATLSFYAPDGLFFTEETICAQKKGYGNPIRETLPSAGQMESQLKRRDAANTAFVNARSAISAMLGDCRAFQFHNTFPASPIRTSCYIDQGAYLRGDAGNLPAFLLSIKNNAPDYYDRIVCAVQGIVPQFRDFSLSPSVRDPNRILLNWTGEAGLEYVFGPHQLSDGSIRFIALAALLLQPERSLPSVVVLDEPELGLHPAAIEALAGMIDTASRNCQVVIATQSAELASYFEPKDICVVEYDQESRSSSFRPLPVESLAEWLKDYSIAELWEKNVIGGRP